jgi:F420H(2)-dependent quinone reductase
MSELQDFNQRVIREFRANQGRVSGPLANMPVLLLTMTGARSGRTITKPLYMQRLILHHFYGASTRKGCAHVLPAGCDWKK